MLLGRGRLDRKGEGQRNAAGRRAAGHAGGGGEVVGGVVALTVMDGRHGRPRRRCRGERRCRDGATCSLGRSRDVRRLETAGGKLMPNRCKLNDGITSGTINATTRLHSCEECRTQHCGLAHAASAKRRPEYTAPKFSRRRSPARCTVSRSSTGPVQKAVQSYIEMLLRSCKEESVIRWTARQQHGTTHLCKLRLKTADDGPRVL